MADTPAPRTPAEQARADVEACLQPFTVNLASGRGIMGVTLPAEQRDALIACLTPIYEWAQALDSADCVLLSKAAHEQLCRQTVDGIALRERAERAEAVIAEMTAEGKIAYWRRHFLAAELGRHAAEADVARLREALHDQETGDNCWCDPGDRDAERKWLPPDQHLDYCVSAREAMAGTGPK